MQLTLDRLEQHEHEVKVRAEAETAKEQKEEEEARRRQFSVAGSLVGCYLRDGSGPTTIPLDGVHGELVGIMSCPDGRVYGVIEQPDLKRDCALLIGIGEYPSARLAFEWDRLSIYLSERIISDHMVLETRQRDIRAFNSKSDPEPKRCEQIQP
jgi:hypothetical protein